MTETYELEVRSRRERVRRPDSSRYQFGSAVSALAFWRAHVGACCNLIRTRDQKRVMRIGGKDHGHILKFATDAEVKDFGLAAS